MIVTRSDFLETLDLYLAELRDDPCYRQARAYYADLPATYELRLDRRGSPVTQLRADARATDHLFLAETAEAIGRAPVLVWLPGPAKGSAATGPIISPTPPGPSWPPWVPGRRTPSSSRLPTG